MENATYPIEKFHYKESHFEGRYTSYSWQNSSSISKIVGETKAFYLVVWGSFSKKVKKVKKENIGVWHLTDDQRHKKDAEA